METLKPVVAYALTGIMSWLAGRYHLSGDQVAAISADVIGFGAAAAGVMAHRAAAAATPEVKK